MTQQLGRPWPRLCECCELIETSNTFWAARRCSMCRSICAKGEPCSILPLLDGSPEHARQVEELIVQAIRNEDGEP